MMSPPARLGVFSAGVLLLLGALEVEVRTHDWLFRSASNRGLWKAAMLDLHGPVDVLFVGTSRTYDGISPRLFSEELATVRPDLRPVQSFNLSEEASTIEVLEYHANRFAGRPGLRLVFIEVSDQQFISGPLQWERAPEGAHGVEGKLADFVNDNVRLVANRKALYLGNLGRLPSLLVFGPALDGSEFDLREQYAAWRGSYFAKTTDPVSDTWQLTGDDVGAATVTASYVPVADRLSRMVAIARRFQDHGVRVVFEVPPLAQSAQDAPERAPVMKAFMRDLERATQSEVWDWSAAIVSDVMFNGKTHLNQRGRALWSKVVALQVAKGNYFDGRGP